MPKIYFDRNDRIIFYGNPAGFVKDGEAVVDELFHTPELLAFLEKRQLTGAWRDGVYERLSAGAPVEEAAVEDAPRLKSVRIWQLKANADIGLKFIGYDEAVKRFGAISPADYKTVWDGHLDTNDLEAIYECFNVNQPVDFSGHSLSISDVVELYDSSGNEFFYCDRCGFTPLTFTPTEPAPKMTL